MAFGTVFAVSLLCALVPCDPKFDPPEVSIRSEYYTGSNLWWGEPKLVNPYPLIFTKSGGLRGYSQGTIHGNRIYAFEGIPYGVPPIGNLRFRAPLPVAPWKGILSAHKPGPKCLQILPPQGFTVTGSENCLFLNIYSPNIPETDGVLKKKSKNIPVVIWLHGGSFIFGSGSDYGPAYISDRDIILVTVNYRLGVLGFLSTLDEASPGNYGLKDQALAMKWIHENIEYFGGDPEKVTLMGQSAGAVSIHLHLVSNKTRQYFRSAISLSGSGFLHWSVQTPKEAKFWTNWLAELVNCPKTTESSHALVECFRSKNPEFLVAYTIRLLKWLVFPPVLFAPVVEADNPEAFLTDTVSNQYKRGEVAKKPWIVTITSEEGYLSIYFVLILQQMKYLRRHFSTFQSFVYDYDHLLNETGNAIVNQKIQEFYFGYESPEDVPTSKIAMISTDRYFTNGQIRAVYAHAQIAPTYSYIFDFNGRTNIGKIVGLKKPEWGVGHGEDVFYYLNSTNFYDGMVKKTPDFQLSQIMINLISNFVHKNVPFYTDKDGKDTEIWEVVKPKQEIRFLYLGKQIKMVRNPFIKRLKFWDSLGIPDITPFEGYKNLTS